MSDKNRASLRTYIGESIDGPFNRLAWGVSSFSSALNPQSETSTWINDVSTTTTTGFQEEWALDGNVFDDDPVMTMLLQKAINRDKGEKAKLYLVQVYTWLDGVTANTYQAYRQPVSWLPSSDGGGDGGGKVVFSGTFSSAGDNVHGEAAITEATDTEPEKCTFTANVDTP